MDASFMVLSLKHFNFSE